MTAQSEPWTAPVLLYELDAGGFYGSADGREGSGWQNRCAAI